MVALAFNELKISEVFTGKHPYESSFLPSACNFVNKETLAQKFSNEFCEIPKNSLFTKHLRVIAFQATPTTGN